MLIYLAGPYRGNTEENIRIADEVSRELWAKGHYVICPHKNSSGFEHDTRISIEHILNGDIFMLSKCDAIVILPNWDQSEGAKIEHDYAKHNHIPIYDDWRML